MRRLIVLACLVALAAWSAPAAAQDASPEPSLAASPAPAASTAPGTPTPAVGAIAWSDVRDPDVRRSGVLRHAVTLGDEVIALAPTTDANGQTVVRVLASGDGTSWVRRGRIRLTGAVEDIIVDGTSLIAVGWDEGATVWRSMDAGRTWTVPADQGPFSADADGRPGLPEDAETVAIARGPAGLLAVGAAAEPDRTRRGAAWRSVDGVAWERVPDVGALPPIVALAGNAGGYVAVTADVTSQAAPTALLWSDDGSAWVEASIDLAHGEAIDGVAATPDGFVAWGVPLGGGDASLWASADGQTWERAAAGPAFSRVRIATIRSVEGGALIIGVGGRPTGAFALPWLGDAWRRDRIRPPWSRACATDMAALRAIVVVVGGTCRAATPRGRAWTSPLEP